MQIILTVKEVFNKGLWDYICKRDGISTWARAEGQVPDEEQFSFSEKECKDLGLIN